MVFGVGTGDPCFARRQRRGGGRRCLVTAAATHQPLPGPPDADRSTFRPGAEDGEAVGERTADVESAEVILEFAKPPVAGADCLVGGFARRSGIGGGGVDDDQGVCCQPGECGKAFVQAVGWHSGKRVVADEQVGIRDAGRVCVRRIGGDQLNPTGLGKVAAQVLSLSVKEDA